MSVRRFDMLVFGGLVAVSFLLGGYAAWRDRGPSLEQMWEKTAKKNVWAWTLPDEEPEVTTASDPVSAQPESTPQAWKVPLSADREAWRHSVLSPMPTDGIPGIRWITTPTYPVAHDLDISVGVGRGVRRMPHPTITSWMQPTLLAYTRSYQPSWLLTDNFVGRAAYNPPKEMVQGTWVRITVHIAAKGDDTDLLGRMIRRPVTWSTKVSRVMSVKLSGETFVVKPLTAETQAMGGGPTEWLFDVQGQEPGEHDLLLAITRIVPVGEMGKQPRAYPPETRSITVTINPVWSTQQFLNAYWQWVATSIAIPLLLWGIALIRQREKKRKAAGFVSAVAPRS